jgi:hypothetical protein
MRINLPSRYQYYADAGDCFIFLSDVPPLHRKEITEEWQKLFKSSKWFTRAWTLQELLASQSKVFISSDWTQIFSQTRQWQPLVCEATKIPRGAISHFRPGKYSFANIASWASGRTATRPEDSSYCLIGLLGINTPLLYGEGEEKAFLRLQIEYLNSNDDDTIFCWSQPEKPQQTSYSGLLATSVKQFKDVGHNFEIYYWDDDRPPSQMTNRGLRIEPLLLSVPRLDLAKVLHSEYLMLLNCRPEQRVHIDESTRFAIRLSVRDGVSKTILMTGRLHSSEHSSIEKIQRQSEGMESDAEILQRAERHPLIVPNVWNETTQFLFQYQRGKRDGMITHLRRLTRSKPRPEI